MTFIKEIMNAISMKQFKRDTIVYCDHFITQKEDICIIMIVNLQILILNCDLSIPKGVKSIFRFMYFRNVFGKLNNTAAFYCDENPSFFDK